MNLLRMLSILSCTLLLVGCSQSQTTPLVPEANIINNPSNATAPTKITEADAKAIALKEVPNGTMVKLKLDLDDHSPTYDITLIDGTTEYSFEIDAYTGVILTTQKEFEITKEYATPLITELEARNIALKEADGGQITAISYEGDEYIPHYDISVRLDHYEYDFEIDAHTGKIIKLEEDLIS